MTEPTYNILFVCTANSARSIIAEALTNALAAGRFKAWSAGSQPSGAVHPMALQELRRLGIPVDGLRSKGWAEFAAPGAPRMDFVFTVCDQAAGEACPVWPGQPVTAHWGMPDPAAAQGSEEARLRAFRDVAVMMKRRIELLLALPVERLDRMAIQHHVREIGQS